jgi:putative transposase
VARLGAQLLMQAALEAEITEFLGRDRYQRAAVWVDARPGSRSGYREVTVKTTAGTRPFSGGLCRADDAQPGLPPGNR